MNAELIKQLKQIKACIVAKEMHGEDWEEQQEIANKIEAVVSYLKDAEGKEIEF